MAQRTGAERFLASIAKSASAGVLLALALAALALAGCGGGSSEEDPSAAPGAEAGAGTTAAAETGGKAGAGGDAGSPQQGGAPAGSGGGAKPSEQEGKKQGPRIEQPQGARERAPTPAEIANATVADMRLESPAIVASEGNPGSLSPTYTCDGKDSWPALRWSGVPAGSAELALYVMNVQPVEGRLFVDWAVAGLDPGLDGLEAGKLPAGAVVGTNGFGERGYSLCPEGRGEIYMFAIYALPDRLGLRPGFDAREAREEVLAVSGNVGLLPALYAHS